MWNEKQLFPTALYYLVSAQKKIHCVLFNDLSSNQSSASMKLCNDEQSYNHSLSSVIAWRLFGRTMMCYIKVLDEKLTEVVKRVAVLRNNRGMVIKSIRSDLTRLSCECAGTKWIEIKFQVFGAIILLLNWLIAALIFSAGYYSAPIFFLLRRIKKCFALPHFAAFSTFCVKSFWLL